MRSELFSLYKTVSLRRLVSCLWSKTSPDRRVFQSAKKSIKVVYKGVSLAVVSFCVGNTLFSLVGYPASVSGASMRPALNSSASFPLSWFQLNLDWVFVNCWAARHYQLSRGEVVVMVSPKDPYDFIIKRLIGIEGDVIVNKKHSAKPFTLKKGSCWVEGDNRETSVDSNSTYGPVSKGLIFGKATHIIWPPERWSKIPTEIPIVKGREIENLGNGKVKIVDVVKWSNNERNLTKIESCEEKYAI